VFFLKKEGKSDAKGGLRERRRCVSFFFEGVVWFSGLSGRGERREKEERAGVERTAEMKE
jgi:hypothetical protein